MGFCSDFILLSILHSSVSLLYFSLCHFSVHNCLYGCYVDNQSAHHEKIDSKKVLHKLVFMYGYLWTNKLRKLSDQTKCHSFRNVQSIG